MRPLKSQVCFVAVVSMSTDVVSQGKGSECQGPSRLLVLHMESRPSLASLLIGAFEKYINQPFLLVWVTKPLSPKGES